MRKVSEVPLTDLKVGDAVIAPNGVRGRIAHISEKPDREDYTIDFEWDNGNKSMSVWHFWCDKIEYAS